MQMASAQKKIRTRRVQLYICDNALFVHPLCLSINLSFPHCVVWRYPQQPKYLPIFICLSASSLATFISLSDLIGRFGSLFSDTSVHQLSCKWTHCFSLHCRHFGTRNAKVTKLLLLFPSHISPLLLPFYDKKIIPPSLDVQFLRHLIRCFFHCHPFIPNQSHWSHQHPIDEHCGE